MTERIRALTEHMRARPKDYATRRGLLGLVSRRRRLLNYLRRVDVQRYLTLIERLESGNNRIGKSIAATFVAYSPSFLRLTSVRAAQGIGSLLTRTHRRL